MLRVSGIRIVLILLSAIPSSAQSVTMSSPPVPITGVVQSFSGNILDVKPATTPAVWVTIPTDLPVDRNALKPSVEVYVEARWAEVCYVASQVKVYK
jgi:hypothetical protein